MRTNFVITNQFKSKVKKRCIIDLGEKYCWNHWAKTGINHKYQDSNLPLFTRPLIMSTFYWNTRTQTGRRDRPLGKSHDFFFVCIFFVRIFFRTVMHDCFFTLLLPPPLVKFLMVRAVPYNTAYKALLSLRQSWWKVSLGQTFKDQVLLASFPLTSVFICIGRLASCRNEIFELPRISSSPWFCSVNKTIVSFCCISFPLRMSLGEEWNNKRATNSLGISRQPFPLRSEPPILVKQ